tara:strand:+ start:202 stop:414 length:213 start_codon:yes stop_codon:yes gene_type:complete
LLKLAKIFFTIKIFLGGNMNVTIEQTNEAMARFLVHRYEKIVGFPILGNEICLTEETFKIISSHDSEFLE